MTTVADIDRYLCVWEGGGGVEGLRRLVRVSVMGRLKDRLKDRLRSIRSKLK